MRKFGILMSETGGKNDEANHLELKSAIPMELEHRHIIKFLHLKGLKLDGIATELSNMYDQDAYAKSRIKYWLYQLTRGRKNMTTQHMGRRPTLDDTDAEILSIHRRSPFPSVRTIADSLDIPASTVYFHLVEKIGFKNYLLRWVSHLLTDEPALKRVELARE
jgi:hypothetical protein